MHGEIKANNLINPIEDPPNISKILDITKYNGQPHCFKWRAHDTAISTIRAVKIPNDYIITAAINSLVVKLWNIDGSILGAFNIDIPLPYKWDITIETQDKNEKKVLKGLICAKEIQTAPAIIRSKCNRIYRRW